jgi:hypothetical protein
MVPAPRCAPMRKRRETTGWNRSRVGFWGECSWSASARDVRATASHRDNHASTRCQPVLGPTTAAATFAADEVAEGCGHQRLDDGDRTVQRWERLAGSRCIGWRWRGAPSMRFAPRSTRGGERSPSRRRRLHPLDCLRASRGQTFQASRVSQRCHLEAESSPPAHSCTGAKARRLRISGSEQCRPPLR